MQKRLQGLLAGLLIGLLLTSGIALAKQGTEMIEVAFDNIKILIDGLEYQPDDGNGNPVEPFIYNGTTYLPVRAIANAFDKDVDWEPQTSTITLGSKNYDWLDAMGYAKYETTGAENTLSAWNKNEARTTNNITYDRGIQFVLSNGSVSYGGKVEKDGTRLSYQTVEYLLNNRYTSFEGTLVTNSYSYNFDNEKQVIIKYYGDGKLLYTSPPMSEGMQETAFKVDVDGCKVLKIHAEVVNPTDSSDYNAIGIVEARLAKK